MQRRSEMLKKLGIAITKEYIEKQASKKEEMLKRANPYEINKWVKDTCGMSANEMIDAIIKTGDILQIYEFFYLIVEIRNRYENYHSLKDLELKSERLERLEETILNSKNAKLIRYCIGFVPGIDLDRYLEALYDTKSEWNIRELSEGEEYKDEEVANPELIDKVKLPEYTKALNKAKEYAEKAEYFPHSLEEYKEYKDDIYVLIERISETRSPYLIGELANYVEHLNVIEPEMKSYFMEDLAKAELETNDAMGIYEFLSSVKVISQEMFEKMVKKIIEIGDEKYMRYTRDFTPYNEMIKGNPIEIALKIKEMKRNKDKGDGRE